MYSAVFEALYAFGGCIRGFSKLNDRRALFKFVVVILRKIALAMEFYILCRSVENDLWKRIWLFPVNYNVSK